MQGEKHFSKPLSMACSGRKLQIVGVDAGRSLVVRLASMGLFLGMEVEVIYNSHQWPILLSNGNSRLTLGRGIAQKVMVVSVN